MWFPILSLLFRSVMAHGAFRTSRQECLMCVSLCFASKNYLPGIFSLHSGNKLLVAQLWNSLHHYADIGAADSFELPGWVSLGACVWQRWGQLPCTLSQASAVWLQQQDGVCLWSTYCVSTFWKCVREASETYLTKPLHQGADDEMG